MGDVMKNKKGFTLIEILAAIIILGVVLLIGVSAISDYIESSRKSSLIATANSYIEEVRGLRATDSLVQSPKNAEALLIPLSEIEIDGNNDLKTPYGNIILDKSYVIVENENEDFNYYISILDDTNHAIVFEDSNLLNNNSITTSRTEIEKMKQITAIKQNLEYIELNDKLYYVSSKNIENSSTVLLDCDALASFTVEINEDWENDNKTITVNMVKEVEGYQYYISERSSKPLKSDSNWQDDNKFVKDRGTYYVFIKNETGEISSGKKVIVDKIDRGIPTCTLKATGEMSTEEYFGTDVIISFASYQDVNTDDLQVSGIKDYGIGSSTGNRFVVQTEDSVDGVTYTGYIEDRAGNIGTCSITVKRKAEFVLTYNNNGGSGCTTKAVIYNNAIGDLCIPTRSGYNFMGWYSNESLTNSINSSTIFKNEYVNVYAKWKANNYKVTFNANGGSVGTSNITVTYDSAYGTLPNPTRSGYTFKGWYTDVAEGTLISNTTIVSTAKDHTLYARWTPNIYTLTYNNNGGTGCTNKQVTYNSDYGTLCTPTRTGYYFLGWYTAASGGTKVTQTSTVTTAQDHTIYAQWKANTYTLTYNNNGGTGCTSKTVTYNSSYGTLCTPTRTGYTFLGWYTAVSGGTQITQSTTMTSTQNHTVYAQWKANTYTLAYNNNGGTGCTSKTVTYNSSYGTLCTPIRTGYTFLGWYTSATGGTQISQSTIMNKTQNHTIYAQWKANNYTLTYNNNGGSGCTNKTVTYNSNYGTLCTPTRTGYNFAGWYTSATGGTQITQSTIMNKTQNHTIYAQWKESTVIDFVNYSAIGFESFNVTSAINNNNLTANFIGKFNSFEKINIPIRQLISGKYYLLCFNETSSGSLANSYNFASSVFGNPNTSTNGNSMINNTHYVWKTTYTGTQNNQCVPFKATNSTMYWVWDMSKFNDNSGATISISYVSINPIEVPNSEYVDLLNTTLHGFNTDGSTYISNANYNELYLYFKPQSSVWEKINMPLVNLTVNANYVLTFTELINGSRNGYPLGYKISSQPITTTNGNVIFYDNNITSIGVLRTHSISFKATSSTMYLVWEFSGMSDNVYSSFQLKNVSLIKK